MCEHRTYLTENGGLIKDHTKTCFPFHLLSSVVREFLKISEQHDIGVLALPCNTNNIT